MPYQTVGGRQTFVLGGVDDLLASLEDSITTLVTIKSSKHVVPIKVRSNLYSSQQSVPMCCCCCKVICCGANEVI